MWGGMSVSDKRGTLLPSLGNPDPLRPQSVWAAKTRDVPVSHMSGKDWAEKELLISNRQLHLHEYIQTWLLVSFDGQSN